MSLPEEVNMSARKGLKRVQRKSREVRPRKNNRSSEDPTVDELERLIRLAREIEQQASNLKARLILLVMSHQSPI